MDDVVVRLSKDVAEDVIRMLDRVVFSEPSSGYDRQAADRLGCLLKSAIRAPEALTRREREVLDYIESSADARGYTPTLTEIAADFGFRSLSSAFEHVESLDRKGYIRKGQPRRARNISLVNAL